MTAKAFLTGHSRQEKEAARKSGPSLRRKSKKLGTKANIRTLTLYEDPTHGFWHIVKHCPQGKVFPDVDRLIDEFSKTGKPPTVQGVHGHRPRPSAARNIDTSSRRRSARTAPKTNRDIYDVPNDDDTETLCSASLLCRTQSPEREEWGPDESTLGVASPAEAASTVEKPDVVRRQAALGECGAIGETDTMEHNAMEESSSVAEFDALPEADHAANTGPMGSEAVSTPGLEEDMSWAASGVTGMDTTLIWDVDNATSMEDPLAWEPVIDMEGWGAYYPETSGHDLQQGFSAVPSMADMRSTFIGLGSHEAQKEVLSRKWAAFAKEEAVALQWRYIDCLW